MLVQIEFRDTDNKGKRLSNKIIMNHCRCVRQSGDGIRIGNLMPYIQRFYHSMTIALLSKDPDNPDIDKVERGSAKIIQDNLVRFLANPTEEGDINMKETDSDSAKNQSDPLVYNVTGS